jgi:hypothetical protein
VTKITQKTTYKNSSYKVNITVYTITIHNKVIYNKTKPNILKLNIEGYRIFTFTSRKLIFPTIYLKVYNYCKLSVRLLLPPSLSVESRPPPPPSARCGVGRRGEMEKGESGVGRGSR